MKRGFKVTGILIFISTVSFSLMSNVDVEDRVDAVFAHMDSESKPGCACSITRDGELVYSNGYGMANFEYDIPISATSIFHVASVSKQFTAMAIELLVNEKKVSWDDDIRKYVPEVPDFGTNITLRHLVHHVSGIRDVWDLLMRSGYQWESEMIFKEDVLDITSRQAALNFQPQDQHLYSNTGYTLLALIVERQTGQSLRDFCKERIFEPLEMNNTHFHDDFQMIVKNRSWGYAPDPDGFLGYKISMPNFYAVGSTGLYTTVEDLAKWEKNFYTMKVGGLEAFSRFYNKISLTNGDTIDYMHGLSEGNFKGLRTISHSGADAGFKSSFLKFPDQNLSVSVLCNFSTSKPWSLAYKVAEIYLEDKIELLTQKKENDVKDEFEVIEDLESLAGSYVHPVSNENYHILFDNGTLIFNAGAGLRLNLVQRGEYRFLIEGTSYILELHPQSASNEGTARLLPSSELHYKREIWKPEKSDLMVFTGKFYSQELDTEYQFDFDGSSLKFTHDKMPSSVMEPLFKNAFSLSGATIIFSDDLQSFTLSDGKIWNITFARSN